MAMEDKGIVFDIQRYSLHDGPGIRTVVFLKGCPLRCAWCCNPESQRPEPQLSYMPSRCIGCGACAGVCPNRAIRLESGKVLFDRSLCANCGACVPVCYSQARLLTGREMTVREVLAQVLKDKRYYENSGGGMTLSGGEMAQQWRFSEALLREAHRLGIHTAVETTGCARWERLQPILEHADLVLYDVKHMDSGQHRRYTGVDAEPIHDNLRRALACGAHVVIRLPLIPGVNDDADNLAATARFAVELGVREVHILPYHRLGVSKYALMGYAYAMPDTLPPEEAQTQAAADVFRQYGLDVRVNG